MNRSHASPWRRLVRRIVTAGAALGLAVGATLAMAAEGEPPGRVGRIADTQGSVWLYDTDAGEWVAAPRNRPLTSGDRLSTDAAGRAELNIGSAVLRLDGGTQVQMLEVDDARVRVQLDSGALALRVRSDELAREFEVVTAEGRFLPQRAGHLRIDRQGDTSFATVWSGGLRFDGPDSALDVPAGQRAEFWRDGNGPTRYTWSELPRDGFADWVLAQDARDRRNEQVWSQRQVSPEMTGVDDLDRYGQWDRHPDYGAVWYPAAVAPGWAPYRYGHWAWVQPWGWTWVDDAPWGFAPFHYGRWVSWGGRWCWAPGPYVRRPAYAPALVGWVGGGNVSIGVTIGGGRPALPPYVGWVPLGPRDPYEPDWRRRYHPQPVRTGPIMYSNQGVPGGVTVVPSQVMRERRPVSGAVVAQVDPAIVREVSRAPLTSAPPAPVVARVAPPSARGVVPAAPGARPVTQAVPVPAAVMPAPRRFAEDGPNRGLDDGTPAVRVAPPRAAVPQMQAQPPDAAVETAPRRVPSQGVVQTAPRAMPAQPPQAVDREAMVPRAPARAQREAMEPNRGLRDGPEPVRVPTPQVPTPRVQAPQPVPQPMQPAPAMRPAEVPRAAPAAPSPMQRAERPAPPETRGGMRERQQVR